MSLCRRHPPYVRIVCSCTHRTVTLHEVTGFAVPAQPPEPWHGPSPDLLTASWGPRERRLYSDSLQAGRFGDRMPVGARFSASVQTDPGVQPASCKMGTGSLSRG